MMEDNLWLIDFLSFEVSEGFGKKGWSILRFTSDDAKIDIFKKNSCKKFFGDSDKTYFLLRHWILSWEQKKVSFWFKYIKITTQESMYNNFFKLT